MEAYDGPQIVGMDLHRRRSVLVRMTEDGRKLATVRITNSVARLAAEIRRAGLYRHYPGQAPAPPFPPPARCPGRQLPPGSGARDRRAETGGGRGPAGLPRDLVTPPASAVTGALVWVWCGPQAC